MEPGDLLSLIFELARSDLRTRRAQGLRAKYLSELERTKERLQRRCGVGSRADLDDACARVIMGFWQRIAGGDFNEEHTSAYLDQAILFELRNMLRSDWRRRRRQSAAALETNYMVDETPRLMARDALMQLDERPLGHELIKLVADDAGTVAAETGMTARSVLSKRSKCRRRLRQTLEALR